MKMFHLVFAILVVLVAQDSRAVEDSTLWSKLRSGGHFVLIRHARAPGVGDPTEFTLRDCATQRNLSDEGRGQAKRIGSRFKAEGMESAQVFSSQWCRCLETAQLLELGEVQELPALNSFFEHRERETTQTRELQKWLADQKLDQLLVLVTHQVNITALVNVYPSSGELVIVHRGDNGKLSVAGTLETP